MKKAFLKWAGGKSALVPQILALVPPDERKGTFYEPFVGSGVVAMNVPFQSIVINDLNPGVVACWKKLQTGGERFIKDCKDFFIPETNTADSFYGLRETFNELAAAGETLDDRERAQYAALFIYLNRHCFNGLCRFNSKGEFNVPYGKYAKPYFPEEELRNGVELARKSMITRYDFADVMNMAQEGDVVYCDPPYLPLSETSNFTAYSAGGFSMDDQIRLKDRAERLRDRGVTVIISNNDTPLARKLYKKADEIKSIQVAKRISCKADGRKKSGEVLVVYRP